MKTKRARAVLRRMIQFYTRHHLPRSAAGLSYFLTLSFFPTLICLYTMLGRLSPGPEEVRAFLSGVLPGGTVETIVEYLRYVSRNLSTTMLFAALIVLATASSAAFRTINGVMRDMRGSARFTDLFGYVFSFLFSLLFLLAVFLGVLIVVTGKWFLDFVDRRVMFMNVSGTWGWARFALLFLLLFVILSGVYRLTGPQGPPARVLPGALAAAGAVVVLSVVFSASISASSRYPLVYGSLASVVIMMLWLYTCSLIVFLGGALNTALEQTAKPK